MTVSIDPDLSTSEKEAIDELKRRISKDLPTKVYDESHLFCRYLRSRDFDVDAAEAMLRKSLQWRKENSIDTILTEYKQKEVLEKYLANMMVGFDKDGCPFYYLPFGNYDMRGLYMVARFPEIEKSIICILENAAKILEKQSKKLNKRLAGYSFIYNVEGLTFGNATCKKGIDTMVRLLNLFQDHYPECLKSIYIINASPLFTIPFSIFKTFLNSRILSKIHFLGTSGWKEELLEQIDADQLPAFLGGTRTDPDGNPLCKTIVNQGGKISEKYYMHKSVNSFEKSPGVKKITLPRASFSEIVLEVEEAGSYIEWEFECKTRDIGFGLFYKEVEGDEEKITELVALQRLETEDFSETGMYKCEKKGDYVILFDNSYSWIRSKEVVYRANVVSSKDHDGNLKH